MYWVNRADKRIERAWMSGEHWDQHPFNENQATNFRGEKLELVSIMGLTLDYSRRALFYIQILEGMDSQLVMCKLYDRNSCKIILEEMDALNFQIFEVFKNFYIK